MRILVVIFEDSQALRYSMKAYLDSQAPFFVIGDFETAENADEIVRELSPDVVVMDVNMPEIGGIQGVRMIKEVRPDTEIIMYTVFEDDEILFDCLCAGADGYLLKNSALSELSEAIENVRKGGAPMSPSIARKVMHSFRDNNHEKNFNLSSCKKEILKFLVKGYSYKMIAAHCFISLSTVQAHIKNIYAKLHVNCGREAVALALRNKIV